MLIYRANPQEIPSLRDGAKRNNSGFHVVRLVINHNPINSTITDPTMPTVVPIRASFTRSISSSDALRRGPNRGSVIQKNNAPSKPAKARAKPERRTFLSID